MARRIFLHIGAPKTGTTYVQNVLWANSASLRKRGILLPGTSRAHEQAMADLRSAPWKDPDAPWTWDRLVDQLGRWHGDVIISNEGLGAATREQAARAVASLAGAEVHVVVAGRDLWRTLPSMWQQSVRARSVWSFETFLRAVQTGSFETFWEEHTPERMFRRWGDLIPPTQRHLVTVPPPGAPYDTLWRRFADVLGIPDGLCELKVLASNPSLGATEIEVLRRVNQALGDRYPHRKPYQNVVQRHLVDAVLRKSSNGMKFGLGPEQAGWVLERAEAQIEELRAYPCRIVGDLEDLRPTEMTPARTPDELETTQVFEAAIETIIGMLGHAEKLSQRPDPPAGLNHVIRRAARKLKRGPRRTREVLESLRRPQG